MILVKIVEMDNGFVVDMVDDASLLTFNECNVRRIASTWEEALFAVKQNYEKILNFRKDMEKESKKREKEFEDKPTKTTRAK